MNHLLSYFLNYLIEIYIHFEQSLVEKYPTIHSFVAVFD